MTNNFLRQQLSKYFASSINTPNYILPTVQNMEAGDYISKIMDVNQVLRADGSQEAVDCYHELSDSKGNVIYVRFRYYNKELQALAKYLLKYPSVKEWQDTIYLQEEVTVQPKATGKYMHITSRKICTPAVVQPPSTTVSASPTTHKLGSLTLRNSGKSSPKSQVKSLPEEEAECDDFEDFADFDED